jgi:hypothetical protein
MPVLAAGLGLSPLVVSAQGVTIDHKAVGCIVAEQYPKMSACFVPTALARSRVYFRAGGTPHWYFVDGRPDMPCVGYVLPKPKRTIKFVDYYVEGMSTTGGEGRTTEYNPIVVVRESECKRDVPVAPFLTRATVVVGATPGAPAIIPGFTGLAGAAAGGLSTGAVVGIVAGGAAVAGTVVALTGNETPTTASAITLPPGVTLPPVTTTTTTTTLATPQPFSAVFKIFPFPPDGKEPFEVTFDECESTGNDLKFIYDFDGDGLDDLKDGCSVTQVYRLTGVSATAVMPGPPPTTLPPASRAFDARACVGQGTRKECRIWHIVVRENTGSSVGPVEPASASASRRIAWATELDLDGGSGQVVVNGEAAAYAARGRSAGAAVGRRGVNRIEAQVVEAAGRPGTWRFELDTTGSLQAGSVRVIAGEVALLTENAVVFRLKGRPGERVVFSFRTER